MDHAGGKGDHSGRSADHPGRDGARVDVAALLHQRADDEPERVGQRERVLEVEPRRVGNARPPVVPLVRREPGQHEHGQAHRDVRAEHVEPDLRRQRVEEGEESGTLTLRTLEQDADAEVHERLREVDHLLAQIVNRQRRHCQISFLQAEF